MNKSMGLLVMCAVIAVVGVSTSTAETNLIVNGDFEAGFALIENPNPLDGSTPDDVPNGWIRWESFTGTGIEVSALDQLVSNGPSLPGVSALGVFRSSGGLSGDQTTARQDLNVETKACIELSLKIDTMVYGHNLEAGGWVTPAFEWPATVEILYETNVGSQQLWRYGWYVNPPGDGRIVDPGIGIIPVFRDEQVLAGVWNSNTFDLFAELPDVRKIIRILVGGSGWNFGAAIDNVELFCRSTNSPPDAPTQPAFQDVGCAGKNYLYTSVATDLDGDRLALQFDWGDGSTRWSDFVFSGEQASAEHRWLNRGQYWVKARAFDGEELSPWSPAKFVSMIDCPNENEPPSVIVSINGPGSGCENDELTFVTSTTDLDGDYLQYIFDWGDGSSTETEFVRPQTPASASHRWDTARAYTYRARAYDGKEYSGWSLFHHITIGGPSISEPVVTWTDSAPEMGEIYELILEVGNGGNCSGNQFIAVSETETSVGTVSGWSLGDDYPQSGVKTQYLDRGVTAKFRYPFAHHWNWIAPWSWKDTVEQALSWIDEFQIITSLTAFKWFLTEKGVGTIPEITYSVEATEADPSDVDFVSDVTVVVPDEKWMSLRLSYGEALNAGLATTAGTAAFAACAPTAWALGGSCWAAIALYATEGAGQLAARELYEAAYDPDPDYTTIAEPEPVGLPELSGSPELLPKSLAVSMARRLSLERALARSYFKHAGAQAADSPEYMTLQLSHCRRYALMAAEEAASQVSIAADVVATLPVLSPEEVLGVRDQLLEEGLPQEEVALLMRNGVTVEEVEDLRQAFLASDLDSLFDAIPRMPEYIRRSAQLLTELAAELLQRELEIRVERLGEVVAIPSSDEILELQELRDEIQTRLDDGERSMALVERILYMQQLAEEMIDEYLHGGLVSYYHFALSALVIAESEIPWCEPADEIAPKPRSFWKRACEGRGVTNEQERLAGYVGCVDSGLAGIYRFISFDGLTDIEGMCDELIPDPRNNKCERAKAQLMALLLNICSGRVAECDLLDDPDLGVIMVGDAASTLDHLLTSTGRTLSDCRLGERVARRVNLGISLKDSAGSSDGDGD